MPAVQPILAVAVSAIGFAGLLRASPMLGRPLAVVLALGLAAGAYFHDVRYGQYFYFKVLSFTGPQLVTAAVVALGTAASFGRTLARRACGFAALAGLCACALLSAREEIDVSYDQLTPETIQLRDWAGTLPAGASIRLDTPQPAQLWQAYMLSTHPLGSTNPIPNYPHVPFSAGADYALDRPLLPPPEDAVGPPIRRNSQLRLWRLRRAAPDRTSRRMVPIFARNVPLQTRGG